MSASKNYSLKLELTFPQAYTPICDTELTALAREQQFLHDVGVLVEIQTTDEVTTTSKWLKDFGIATSNFLVSPPPTSYDMSSQMRATRETHLYRVDEGKYDTWLYSSTQSSDIGRNIGEIIRIIEAALTEEPCPEGWRAGNKTFKDKFTCEK